MYLFLYENKHIFIFIHCCIYKCIKLVCMCEDIFYVIHVSTIIHTMCVHIAFRCQSLLLFIAVILNEYVFMYLFCFIVRFIHDMHKLNRTY